MYWEGSLGGRDISARAPFFSPFHTARLRPPPSIRATNRPHPAGGSRQQVAAASAAADPDPPRCNLFFADPKGLSFTVIVESVFPFSFYLHKSKHLALTLGSIEHITLS